MQIWLARIGIGLAGVALCTGQAMAQDWVKLGTSDSGDVWSVEKDSIDPSNDGLVYFTDQISSTAGSETSDEAIDCAKRIEYLLKTNADYMTDWRDHGHAIESGSAMDAMREYVCAAR